MKKLITLILTTFIFLGCTATKDVEIQAPKYPSWYINPNLEDTLFLYGIGEGNSIDEAIKSALLSISSRLSLNISSTSSIKSKSYTDYREYITKESSQNIFSKTENLTFNNYILKNSKKIGFNSFIVKLKIKKIDLINSLSQELKNSKELLNTKEKLILNKDPLTKYITYKTIFDNYNSKINKVQILKNLKKDFDDKSYYDKLKNLYSNMIKNKSSSTFYISNTTKNQTISNKLKASLNNEDFLVLKKDKALYNIEISSTINSKNTHGFYIVNNNISFKIYFNNNLIKTKNYMIKGVSSNSADDAIHNSYENLHINNLIEKVSKYKF